MTLLSLHTSLFENEYNLTELKTSAPLGYSIHIDGNWTDTEGNYSWCTGAGTSGNPYIIQNIEIDANGGYGILIGNTTEYFRIENVVIYDSGTPVANSSMVFDNVDNGYLLWNDLSDGSYLTEDRKKVVEDNMHFFNRN